MNLCSSHHDGALAPHQMKATNRQQRIAGPEQRPPGGLGPAGPQRWERVMRFYVRGFPEGWA